MKQRGALKLLNKERDYEDDIVENLNTYFVYSLDGVKGLSESEKDKIKKYLSKIATDSARHSIAFSQLISSVLDRGDVDY